MKTNLIGISGKIGSGKDTVGKILQYLDYCNRYPNNTRTFKDWLENSGTSGKLKIKKFADKLKDIVCLLIGCTREQLEDREFKEKELGEEWNKLDKIALLAYNKDNPLCHEKGYLYNTMTPREIMQLLGTECGREILHPNIWVNALFADYKPYSYSQKICMGRDAMVHKGDLFPSWIMTDVRFPNECEAIKQRGGIVIRVNRDDFVTNSKTNERFKVKVHKTEHPSEKALDNYDGFDHVIDNNLDIPSLIEKVKQLKLV